MGKKIGCGVIATACFAQAALFCKWLHELFDEDGNIVFTILMATCYVFGITATAATGLFFYLAMFATGGEVETESSEEEETEAS